MSDLYDIAASGMAAQRTQMDLIAENLANAGVVRADGSVFRPKVAVVQSAASFEPALHDAVQRPIAQAIFSESGERSNEFTLAGQGDIDFFPVDDSQDSPEPSGVTVAGIVEERRQPQFRLDPGNPFAQKSGPHKGYLALPDVDPIEQMIALVASGRAYDADVSMLQAAKQMDLEAADIDRA
jgi:flagellar basal-body rod protein FlgC